MRKAIVAELLTYGKEGKLEEIMSTLYKDVPNYTGFGGCEYPHPDEHHHEFPFKDAIDCLIKETKSVTSATLYWIRPSKTIKSLLYD